MQRWGRKEWHQVAYDSPAGLLQSGCFSPGIAHQRWALLTYLPLL